MDKQKGLSPIALVLLIAAAIGGYLFYQNQQSTNPQVVQESSTSPTQQDSELSKFMSFTLPEGWKDEELVLNSPNYQNSNIIASFISQDYEENAIPQITKGARIVVFRYPHDSNKILREEVIDNLPLPLQNQADEISSIKIDGKEGLNKFVRYEGSYDHNYIVHGNYRWDIRFECAPDCESKEKMESSKYAKDRDSFLESIKFLDQNTEEQEYLEFNGRKLLIERKAEGEYCEGYVGSQQTTYPKCEEGLKCVQAEGTIADAPGTCRKE